MNIQIGAFTDHMHTPSSRFRLRQYFLHLASQGIYLKDYYRKYSTETAGSADGNKRIRSSLSLMIKASLHETANIFDRLNDVLNSNKYDAIWLSRQLVIGYPTFEWLLRKPIIYDIDDAIFLNGKASYYQFKVTSKKASAVIAGNSFIAEEAAKYCNNVHIVPTAVDTLRWFPSGSAERRDQYSLDEFRIGWCGTSASFHFFKPIQHELRNFLINFTDAKFLIMSDKFPYELEDLKSHVNFIKWSPDLEVDFVRSLNVGLMPMKDDLWSRGKCAYKMLLYASCGIPVIVTPIGVNKQILESATIGFGASKPGEWYEALRVLYFDDEMCKNYSENGVRLVKEHYSVDVCAPVIEGILRRYV